MDITVVQNLFDNMDITVVQNLFDSFHFATNEPCDDGMIGICSVWDKIKHTNQGV